MRSLAVNSTVLAPTTVNGVKPCLTIAKYRSRDGERGSLLPFTSRSNRKFPAPGWVVVHRPDGGLEVDSHLRLDSFKLLTTEVECEIGSLKDTDYVRHIRANLAALLSGLRPSDPAYWQTFLPELDPPGHRAPKHAGELGHLYHVLQEAGWRNPERGDILRCPKAHADFGGDYWLVVSNTEFNRRFRYPHMFIVQLWPTRETGSPAETWTEQGRLVIPSIGDGVADLVAFEETMHCFDVSQGWLDSCSRCYSPDLKREFNLSVRGATGATCLWCDGGTADWPTKVGTAKKAEMDFLNRLLADHFDLPAEGVW